MGRKKIIKTEEIETPITESSIKVSEKLGNFDVVIDAFGKIKAQYNVDDINAFLNENVDDKKLRKSPEMVEKIIENIEVNPENNPEK